MTDRCIIDSAIIRFIHKGSYACDFTFCNSKGLRFYASVEGYIAKIIMNNLTQTSYFTIEHSPSENNCTRLGAFCYCHTTVTNLEPVKKTSDSSLSPRNCNTKIIELQLEDFITKYNQKYNKSLNQEDFCNFIRQKDIQLPAGLRFIDINYPGTLHAFCSYLAFYDTDLDDHIICYGYCFCRSK